VTLSTVPQAQAVGHSGMPVWLGYLTDSDPGEREVVLSREHEYAVGYGLSKPDRLEVVATLTRRGRSAREIALTLGTAERTVLRYRREIKERNP
jgi:DNA-binding NarL/FixJ family response regulator